MRFLLFVLACSSALAQPVMPFSPSSGGGGGGAESDPLACKVAGLTNCQMLAQIRGNAGTASLPSFASPLANAANDGLYFPAAATLGLATDGTLRLTLGNTSLTSTVQWAGITGSAAIPSISFSADPNTGIFSAASDDIGFAANGTSKLLLNTAALRPTTSAGLSLGTTAQLWSDVFTRGVKGNNTTITIQPGTTATSAQGTVVAGYADTTDDAASLRIQTATGGGSSGVGVQALVVSEGGTTHTDIERIDSTGAGLWGVRTGTVQVGSLGANTVGSAPAGLVTCTSTLNGTLAIKTDTDTAGTAPALCLCSRDNTATTYSWKAVSVGTLTGSCP